MPMFKSPEYAAEKMFIGLTKKCIWNTFLSILKQIENCEVVDLASDDKKLIKLKDVHELH